MADASAFGGGVPGIMQGGDDTDYSGPDSFGSGLNSEVGGGASAPAAGPGADVPPGPSLGARINNMLGGPNYTPPDPNASPLDQTADTLQQRIKRANSIATNPLLGVLNPQAAAAARNFVPAATEKLQQIRTQQAAVKAGREQAQTLGLSPGEVPDEATQADRVTAAVNKSLQGNLQTFRGLQVVDPQRAAAIQDQVHQAASVHLTNAQAAFDKLSNMRNPGEYDAAIASLRKDGTLNDLEAIGLKVPPTFDAFNASKVVEGQQLRQARMGMENLGAEIEKRGNGTPMPKDEAATYSGRLTTSSGDALSNGTWMTINGKRAFVANGMGDIRDLGKKFSFANNEQRKAIQEEFAAAAPKEDMEKYRGFARTYQLATTDANGNALPNNRLNTNPNVQQAIAEGLASTLRGGGGGANKGLLSIEESKRGYVQGLLDTLQKAKGGAINTLTGKDVAPYLTQATQEQQRAVLDFLNGYNKANVSDRAIQVAERAGQLGLDSNALGFGKDEAHGAIQDALERGRQDTINRFTPRQRATNGGDGAIYLDTPPPRLVGGPPNQDTTEPPPVPAPVQPKPAASASGGQSPAPPAGPNAPTPPGAPGTYTIAGQNVNVALPPGASPQYVQATQRIESGNERSPWTARTPSTSASGAFQFTNQTWTENKPAGAPDRASAATPQQQATAFANLTQKNANALSNVGVPVNDVNLYVAHNLGSAGAAALLKADPNADARSVVGATAAANNPLFFRGKPTVAQALQRYRDEMAGGDERPKPKPGSGGAAASFFDRLTGRQPGQIADVEGSGIQGDHIASPAERAASPVAEYAPAIGSTVGAVGGAIAGGPAGGVAGGAAGGGAGQALKDYLQGNAQSPRKIAEQAALGGVLGVMPEGRPVVGALVRATGAGAVEGANAAAAGENANDVVNAVGTGAGEALGGEMFGRALGMAGHKVFSMFSAGARKTVQEAAKTYSEAEAALTTEQPKLAGANGASAPNPKYDAAVAAKEKAEKTLTDAGLNPEEAAYAHRVSSEGVPKQEAEAAKPGALEQADIGKGYNQLRTEIGATGVGAPKASPALADGPIAAVKSKQVSAAHQELAEHVEAAITAPAPDWATKWDQLVEARSDLLKAERDALTSTATGRTKTAADMRTLADTVRAQQEKAAKYVFGEANGAAFMQRLKTLDVRYRNLMEATNDGDLMAAASMKGAAGREADRKFRAFAHDDPAALAAWDAMRKTSGASGKLEQGVHDLVAAEKIPVIGKVFSAAKLAGSFNEWMRRRAAGSPVSFADALGLDNASTALGRRVRNITGSAASRGAVMGGSE